MRDPRHDSKKQAESRREGYETTDVSINGIIVFLIGLSVSVVVFFVFCFVTGKVINNQLVKHDGPPNQWNQFNMPSRARQDMASNPAIEQQQLRDVTQRFPTPRLQTDDGDQDTADMHAREDLLLENYSWIDRAQGRVRIPVSQAMQIIAQRGLPVVPNAGQPESLMAGDSRIEIPVPLTTGFARTGYEQEERSPKKLPGEQASTKIGSQDSTGASDR